VSGALLHLRRGDRLALYTTHCAHNLVTGNKPELHYPIHPLASDTENLFMDLTANICRCGTQVWDPARPNVGVYVHSTCEIYTNVGPTPLAAIDDGRRSRRGQVPC
jgi:hypothetical protein